MGPIRLVARPMLASIFVTGGAAALADPEAHVPAARDVTARVAESVEEHTDAPAPDETQLVQLNGLAQVVGGLLLAFGKLPRVAALLLAGSLLPTTLAAHRFWEHSGEERQRQQTHFFKNVSLLGGLLLATLDREGRPGLVWRGKHAREHAENAAEHARETARLRKELTVEKARNAASVDPKEHLAVRRDLLKEQLIPDLADAKRLVDALRSDD